MTSPVSGAKGAAVAGRQGVNNPREVLVFPRLSRMFRPCIAILTAALQPRLRDFNWAAAVTRPPVSFCVLANSKEQGPRETNPPVSPFGVQGSGSSEPDPYYGYGRRFGKPRMGLLPSIASKESLNLAWLRFAPVQAYFGANREANGLSRASAKLRPGSRGSRVGTMSSMRIRTALALVCATAPVLLLVASTGVIADSPPMPKPKPPSHRTPASRETTSAPGSLPICRRRST